MSDFLDHYCERVLPTLWDEPLNVTSNIAFLIATYFIIRQLPRREYNTIPWDLWILIILVPVIGAGSALWHLLAVEWTLWADRIPIIIFISLFMLSSLVRTFHLAPSTIAVLFLLFHLLNTLLQVTAAPTTLNGSLFYFPAFLCLAGMTVTLWMQHNSFFKIYFLYATVAFLSGIAARTVDLTFCDYIPTGTHFIWHILVSLTIYLLMSGLLQSAHLISKTDRHTMEHR